jgi:hypothetical protein
MISVSYGRHRVFHQRGDDSAGLLRNEIVLRLGLLHTVEHFLGRFSCETGNVGEPALRIGQLAHGAAQLLGIAQLVERIVQLACQLPDLVVNVGGIRQRNLGWHHGVITPFS